MEKNRIKRYLRGKKEERRKRSDLSSRFVNTLIKSVFITLTTEVVLGHSAVQHLPGSLHKNRTVPRY